jgi:hypothetical protein
MEKFLRVGYSSTKIKKFSSLSVEIVTNKILKDRLTFFQQIRCFWVYLSHYFGPKLPVSKQFKMITTNFKDNLLQKTQAQESIFYHSILIYKPTTANPSLWHGPNPLLKIQQVTSAKPYLPLIHCVGSVPF